MKTKFLLKISLFALMYAGLAKGQTVMFIDPPVVPAMAPGDTFWISLNIADVVNLQTWQAYITFNPQICTVLVVTEGPFLKRGGASTSFQKDIVYSNPAHILCGSVRGFGNYPGTWGSGTLARMKFKVKSSGSFVFNIERFSRQNYYHEESFLWGNDTIRTEFYSIPFLTVDGYYGLQSVGNSRTEILISNAPNHQEVPAVAWADTQYLAVWQDKRSVTPQYDVYGQRISRSGTLCDTNFAITNTMAFSETSPSICWNDSVWMVVYKWSYSQDTISDDHNLYCKFITANGSPGTQRTICRAPSIQRMPAIASNGGGRQLVVWEDYRKGQASGDADIFGKIINRSGDSLTQSFVICNDSNCQFSPHVVWGDNKFLVVWSDNASEIYGRFVDSLGNTISSKFLISSSSGTGTMWKIFPRVAFSGNNFLVVWCQEYVDIIHGYYSDIYGQRVSLDGALLDSSFSICNEAHYQTAANIFWNGTEYVVLWQDERNGCADIYGQRICADGTFIGTNFSIASSPYNQIFPAGASDHSNSILAIWADYRNSQNYDIWGYIGSEIGIRSENKNQDLTANPAIAVHPNPFSKTTEIQLMVNNLLPSIVRIYDVTGRLVREFDHLSPKLCGISTFSSVVWDGKDNTGKELPGGIYFIYFETPEAKGRIKAVKIQ
jgi:hypothetical protein